MTAKLYVDELLTETSLDETTRSIYAQKAPVAYSQITLLKDVFSREFPDASVTETWFEL